MANWTNVITVTKKYYYDNDGGLIIQNKENTDSLIRDALLDFGVICKEITEANILNACEQAGISEGLKYSLLLRYFDARQDEKNIFKYAQLGAEARELFCTEKLADCYQCGIGTTKNTDLAYEYLTEALKLEKSTIYDDENIIGDIYGSLGFIHYTDKNDFNKAVYYWNKGAEHGDAMSMYNLSHCYITGLNGHTKNLSKGLSLLEAAGNLNNKDACLVLAFLYKLGKYPDGNQLIDMSAYIKTDYKKALYYLNRIVEECKITKEHYNAFAKTMIGDIYFDGLGVPKDEYKAFEYYYEAAMEGEIVAQKCVAKMYGHGKGTEQNLEKQLYWIEKAAAQGDNECIEFLKEYKKENSSGGCYVATCVYGSYDCPQVWTLRRFRDYTLDEYMLGRLFIKLYYRFSPIIVAKYGENKSFRTFWRFVLDRMVKQLRNKGISDTPYKDKY